MNSPQNKNHNSSKKKKNDFIVFLLLCFAFFLIHFCWQFFSANEVVKSVGETEDWIRFGERKAEVDLVSTEASGYFIRPKIEKRYFSASKHKHIFFVPNRLNTIPESIADAQEKNLEKKIESYKTIGPMFDKVWSLIDEYVEDESFDRTRSEISLALFKHNILQPDAWKYNMEPFAKGEIVSEDVKDLAEIYKASWCLSGTETENSFVCFRPWIHHSDLIGVYYLLEETLHAIDRNLYAVEEWGWTEEKNEKWQKEVRFPREIATKNIILGIIELEIKKNNDDPEALKQLKIMKELFTISKEGYIAEINKTEAEKK